MPLITKDHRIQIVSTRKQLEAWRACAEREGLTLSAWLRKAAAEAEAAESNRCVTMRRDDHSREPHTIGA